MIGSKRRNGRGVRRIRSKVFAKLLLSFLAMLMIPAALTVVDFFRYQNILWEETLRYQASLLEQVQKTVDERLENIRLVAIDISMDSAVNRYTDSEGLEGGSLGVSNYQITNLLNNYRQVYRSVTDILLYTMHYDKILSTQNVYSGPLEEYALLEDPSLGRSLVGYFEEERLYCQFVTIGPGAAAKEKALFLLQSVPLWSIGRDATGVIAIQVDTDDLFRDISEISGLQEGLVCLLDEKDVPLAAVGDITLLEEWTGADGKETEESGSDYIVNSVDSRLTGWRYILVQPQQLYAERLRAVLGTHLLLVCALTLAGIASAYLFSRGNYIPLERVMAKIRKESALGEHVGQDSEYEYIEASISSLTQYMHALQSTLEQEMPRIQENMLYQLLTGAVADYDGYSNGMMEMGLLMPYPSYVIVLLEITSYPSGKTEEQEVFKVMLRQQASRFLPQDVSYGAADIGQDKIAFLLNGRIEGLEAAADEAMEQLLDYARAELLLILTICISEPVNGLENVTGAYYATQRLLDRRRIAGGAGVARVRENREQDKLCACPEELLTRLANLVSVGDEEQALAALEKGYQMSFAGRSVDIHMARSYFITLVDTALRGVRVQGDAFDAFWAENNPIPALSSGNTPESMQAVVQKFVRQVCDLVREERKGHADALKTAILGYIGQNYSDNNLSLSGVADHFQITPNYLSAFFRENVGDTFLNTLTGMRIAKAKQLLRDTNDAIETIARKVGYSGSNSFIRNYKKLEHITPGEYRDILRRNQG